MVVGSALIAATLYCCVGVSGFSGSFRPMTVKVSSFLSGKLRSPYHAVASNNNLSTERLDTKQHQGINAGGSLLEMNCRDQHEFELSVGHAMDTLRTDYPDILTENPGM